MEPMTVTVAINRKIALPGYENVDIRMEVHNVEAGATEAEIEEALETGDLAIELLTKHILNKMKAVKSGSSELG